MIQPMDIIHIDNTEESRRSNNSSCLEDGGEVAAEANLLIFYITVLDDLICLGRHFTICCDFLFIDASMLMSLSTAFTTRRCIAQETFCEFEHVINVTIIIIMRLTVSLTRASMGTKNIFAVQTFTGV